MSTARECDLCGALFKTKRRCVTLITIGVAKDKKESYITWSDVDFCGKCSEKLLAVIEPALLEIPQ